MFFAPPFPRSALWGGRQGRRRLSVAQGVVSIAFAVRFCAGQRFIFAGQSALCPVFHALHEKYPLCQAEAATGRVLFHKWGGDVAASPPTPSRRQKIYIKEKEI